MRRKVVGCWLGCCCTPGEEVGRPGREGCVAAGVAVGFLERRLCVGIGEISLGLGLD